MQARNTLCKVAFCPTAPQVAEAPPGEVWSPSLMPLHTEMLQHQLNTTAAQKVQDPSAWMQTKKEFFKVIFRARSAFIFEMTSSA